MASMGFIPFLTATPDNPGLILGHPRSPILQFIHHQEPFVETRYNYKETYRL